MTSSLLVNILKTLSVSSSHKEMFHQLVSHHNYFLYYMWYTTQWKFIAQKLNGVHNVNINIEKDPEEARIVFNSFLASLFTNWQSTQIDEEDGIISA